MSAVITPGPWFIQKNSYGDVIVSSDSICVCNVGRDARGNGPAVANFGHEQGSAVDADARLIAAAPELYEMLEWLSTSYDLGVIGLERTQKLLAKARGEA